MNSNIIDIDLYGNPILQSSMLKMLTEAAKIQLKNEFNCITFDEVTKNNYFSFFSERIKSERGIYLISRVGSPIIRDTKYMYVGSSCYDLAARVSKFVRAIFDLNTQGDRDYAYCDLYIKQFGRNLENTTVTCFEIPKQFDNFISERDVRYIEGQIILDCKSHYGNIVANKINKPTIAKMTTAKKNAKSSHNTELPKCILQ